MPRIDISDLHLTRHHIPSFDGITHNAADFARLMTRTLTGGKTLTRRADSASTCAPNNNSAYCQKPTDSSGSGTLTIVLGAVIPITVALVVLLFLHRRLVKKRKIEDANDKYKSLDFGDGPTVPSAAYKKGKRGMPEMSMAEMGSDMRPGRRPRGMSMDMDMGSPYILPSGLHSSRESVHSMSRSMRDDADPYRPIAMVKDNASMRSFVHPRGLDGGSTYSASTGFASTNEKAGLVPNAQTMAKTLPKRAESKSSPHDSKNEDDIPPPVPSKSNPPSRRQSKSNPPSRRQSLIAPKKSARDIATEANAMQEEFAVPPIQSEATSTTSRPPRKSSMGGASRQSRKDSTPAPPLPDDSYSGYGSNYYDGLNAAAAMPPPPPPQHMDEYSYDIDPSMIYTDRYSVEQRSGSLAQPTPQHNRLSIMGLRPLPPDHPEENPEQRANRIRSFYKEYFDEGRGRKNFYEEDYSADFLADGAIFDPETGGFITGGAKPWNHNVGRRAMTPPPRGAPRHSGRSSNGPGPHRRHLSTGMRGRIPPPQPKKRLPPPKPLQTLGTPHMLRDDSAIFNASEFAPPTSFREIQIGRRPDSPLGGARPYSPAFRAHTPLQSSFTDLRPMPSPHELRKSSTFTALDFAPPRFAGQDGASDAGSIRSARSGISAVQHNAVRNGAYRVSRIPQDVVTTRDNLSMQLKPTWGLRDNNLM